eukprot:c5793_g1_i1.p1 GENE.c5793_g1_i1~~c5793_g1_i1.p1  ORF type:complete len:777 (-),score=168.37 c5793_g1_i1:70-2400(-)
MRDPVPTPFVKDLVLVGGGHAHVHVLKMFGMKPLPGVRVTVISRDVESPYSGMLPGHIAGIYTREQCHINVMRLCVFAGAIFVHAEVSRIDTNARLIYVKDEARPPISYDILSIDIGITPDTKTVDPTLVTPVKPIDSFSRRWDAILERTKRPNIRIRIMVVGAGPGGVELCLNIQTRLFAEMNTNQSENRITMQLLTRSSAVMQGHNRRVQRKFHRILLERGVEVHTNATVTKVISGKVICENGKEFEFDECFWCTQAAPQEWLRETGLAVTEEGFVRVEDTLESENVPGVFASGDCASVTKYPRPKAGVFAVRQGPPLFKNLRLILTGKKPVSFRPQNQFMSLVGTGDPNTCVMSRGAFALEGAYLWRLKDWIDRRWMEGYKSKIPFNAMMPANRSKVKKQKNDFEQVAEGDDEALEVIREAAMRCGGCGAKVGETVLSNVMAKIKPKVVHRPEVLQGLDNPDDCAVVSVGGATVCFTVDFFRSFVSDPYVFGRIAANHALSDCHAMGVEAQTAMAIAVVPHARERIVEATLLQMMAGACETLKQSNCALVGGHTCEGAELSLGFSVSGVTDQNTQVLGKQGMRPSHTLILTKAIGTGTLFAADMRGGTKSGWIVEALESMMQSNYTAATTLRKFGATSCTDVTGFGLVGHLYEMCSASGVGATVFLDKLPLLSGALECVNNGTFSSLQHSNLRLRRAVSNHGEISHHPVFPLLFDPQTAGGLLASVPANQSAECIAELKSLGYRSATAIGYVSAVEAPPKYITCRVDGSKYIY